MSSINRLPVLMVLLVCLSSQLNLVRAVEVELYQFMERGVKLVKSLGYNATVGDFRKIVANELEVELDKVRLLTTDDIELLNDQEWLSDHLHIYEKVLRLRIYDSLTEPGQIQVYYDEHKLDLIVTKDKTLDWVREQTVGEENSKAYSVLFQGKELLDTSKTLGDYKFFNGASMVLFQKGETFTVTVNQLDGKMTRFNVTVETKVKDLRQMIESNGYKVEGMSLTHWGKHLEDDNTLISYSVLFKTGMVINVVPLIDESGAVVLLIRRVRANIIRRTMMHVKPTTTVGELKESYAKVERNVSAKKIKLKLEGELWNDDERKLGDLKVYRKAKIEVL